MLSRIQPVSNVGSGGWLLRRRRWAACLRWCRRHAARARAHDLSAPQAAPSTDLDCPDSRVQFAPIDVTARPNVVIYQVLRALRQEPAKQCTWVRFPSSPRSRRVHPGSEAVRGSGHVLPRGRGEERSSVEVSGDQVERFGHHTVGASSPDRCSRTRPPSQRARVHRCATASEKPRARRDDILLRVCAPPVNHDA